MTVLAAERSSPLPFHRSSEDWASQTKWRPTDHLRRPPRRIPTLFVSLPGTVKMVIWFRQIRMTWQVLF